MKAEDLMVGDRVLLFDDKPVKVDCIGNVEVYLSDENGIDWRVTYEHIKPIPLTPEILEKNGFRIRKANDMIPVDRYWWAVEGTRDGIMIEITLYAPDVNGVKVLTRIHMQSSHESGVNMLHSCDIESVHELQHALRLCGIEKEIVI